MLEQLLICSSACAELGQILPTAAGGVIPIFILHFASLPELCLAALAPGKLPCLWLVWWCQPKNFCSSCAGMDLWGGKKGMGGGQWLCLGCVSVLSLTGRSKKMFSQVVFATFHFTCASALPLRENRN